jgi:hypothetical protein
VTLQQIQRIKLKTSSVELWLGVNASERQPFGPLHSQKMQPKQKKQGLGTQPFQNTGTLTAQLLQVNSLQSTLAKPIASCRFKSYKAALSHLKWSQGLEHCLNIAK